jgi:hypothetical protein
MEGRDRNEHLLALKGYVYIMQINTGLMCYMSQQ